MRCFGYSKMSWANIWDLRSVVDDFGNEVLIVPFANHRTTFIGMTLFYFFNQVH